MNASNLTELRRSCADCGLYELCLPAGIDGEALERLEQATRDKRVVPRGEYLFRQGDAFHSLYVLRSGALRTSIADTEGTEQVIGFGFPGEIAGIDGLVDDTHRTDALALVASSLCEVPYARLEQVLAEVPALQRQLMRVLGREVASEHDHLVAMGRPQAVERVALFLRGMAERHGRLSRQADWLTLPMARADIANYLGLAVETVSRALGRMASDGILAVSGRTVRILDADRLAATCVAGDRDKN